MTDSLEYWEERRDQIAWRLHETRNIIKRMEADYRECTDNIKRLMREVTPPEPIEENDCSNPWSGIIESLCRE